MTFQKKYELLPDEKIGVTFFAKGFEYNFLGFIKADRHLIGFTDPATLDSRPSIFLLGSDSVGRDSWSRLMLANRISLSIGLIGVAITLILGIMMGGISGYYGGWVDTIIQRIIEVKSAIPT